MGSKPSWMTPRLGEVLARQGLLAEAQVDHLLTLQAENGRPIGALAEEHFGVSAEAIEDAWVTQYAHRTRTVDPVTETPREDARVLVTRRQAWQFGVMPMALDGDTLVLATTPRHLRRALRFAFGVLDRPAYFQMTTDARLAQALDRWYPMPGLSDSAVSGDGIRRLITKMRIDTMRETG